MIRIKSLSDSDKNRIELIGPNYIRPEEIAYYKQMNKNSTPSRRSKKATVESKTINKKKYARREMPSKMMKPSDLPAEYRANCPNIDCLSAVDTDDNLKDELLFTCFRCGCERVMSKKFAFRMSK